MKTYYVSIEHPQFGLISYFDIKAENLKAAKKIAQFNKRRLTRHDLGTTPKNECRTITRLAH